MSFTVQTKHAPSKNKHVAQAVKHARLIERSRREARIVEHTDPPHETIKLRARLERSLASWLCYYLTESFTDPWSADHKKILAKIEACVKSGGMFAEAMPRGHGKSTICKGAVLYAILTGYRKYVVPIGATAEHAQALVDFVRQQIMENDRLHEHYPHVTTYARATDGKAIKARYQLRADGKLSGINWSKNTLVIPEVVNAKGKEYKSNGAIIEAHGLTGAIRGKWKDTKTGKVLRPDLVILDDPQTRESAESESQCNMRERIITGDILGLAGPRKRIAAVMPCTIVRRNDLADRFLSHEHHPEWQGETCALVYKWPDAQKTLWAEYGKIYKEETSEGRGFTLATEFYRTNRDAMDVGAIISWSHRIRDKEISALQTAENLLLEMGPQFWAEYQNQPIDEGAGNVPYTITPQLISTRMASRQPYEVPAWVGSIIASTDLNPSYALTSTIIGFGKDQTAGVLWYGCFTTDPLPIKNELPQHERAKKLYQALQIHGQQLAQIQCKPESWWIDASGEYFDTVLRFCALSVNLCGLQATGCTGQASKKYKPYGKNIMGVPREGCHMRSDISDGRRRKWLAWNADFWKEIAQRAWLGNLGAPGSLSLFMANSHDDFATQICREKLMGKAEIGGEMIWNWHTAPGPHDYGDTIAQAYAAAAWGGIGTGDGQAKPKNEPMKMRVLTKNKGAW